MVLLLSMVTSRLILTRRSYLSCLVSSSCWKTADRMKKIHRFEFSNFTDEIQQPHGWEMLWKQGGYLWKQRRPARTGSHSPRDLVLLQHFSRDLLHLTWDRGCQVILCSVINGNRCISIIFYPDVTRVICTCTEDTRHLMRRFCYKLWI